MRIIVEVTPKDREELNEMGFDDNGLVDHIITNLDDGDVDLPGDNVEIVDQK